MKWILFTGTWRLKNSEVENDVRLATRQVFENGDGLLTGGQQASTTLQCMSL